MSLKDFNILRNIWIAIKDFFTEDGLDKSSVLAYYSILSTMFLMTFFTFLFTKFLGNPDISVKTIYPFSTDFLSKISPDIFKRAEEVSSRLKDVGMIGILFSFFLGFLIFRKVIQFVNDMYHVELKKGFFYRRLREFGLMFLIALLMIVSFFFTGFISTINSLFAKNEFIASHINPTYIEALNTFLIKYLVPFAASFLLFFILYKWIPEKKVYLKGAMIAALISACMWEIVKRGYAYYLVNISIIGKIKGPIIAIILFGFWMEISMGIMLYGAKLTHVFNEEKNAKLKGNMPEN